MFQNVSECLKMSQNIKRKCLRMSQIVKKCLKMSQNVMHVLEESLLPNTSLSQQVNQ